MSMIKVFEAQFEQNKKRSKEYYLRTLHSHTTFAQKLEKYSWQRAGKFPAGFDQFHFFAISDLP